MSVRPGPLNPLLEAEREYPFATLERKRHALEAGGVRVINFGLGDPQEETPPFVRDALRQAVPARSRYPSVPGQPALRSACAGWLERRFGVRLDPERQLLPVNGSKEGIFLLALAVVDARASRRTVVIPSPGYPVYEQGARYAGAEPHFLRLEPERKFRPDLGSVPEDVWERTALLWLNYPHNPTGAVADDALYRGALELGRRHGFWVASDEAYAEIYFDRAPRSLLEFGLENALAFHSLSKRSAMTGYRSGFMAGDATLIAALRRFRPSVGVATPDFVQAAAIAAWSDDRHTMDQRALYAAKRRLLLEWMETRRLAVLASEATFYLWMRAPGGDDRGFAERLLERGIVVLPGSELGPGGEGFCRWALVPTLEECREAVERLQALPSEVP